MAVYTIQDTTLTAIADAIREKISSTDDIKPTEMADMVSEMLIIPDTALNLSGDCSYRFSYGGLNWLIDIAGDKITTKNLLGNNLFYYNTTIEVIPFVINCSPSSSMSSIFDNCSKLKILPEITNFNNGSRAFNNCYKLTSLNNNQLSGNTTQAYVQDTFNGCYCLRSIDNFLDNVDDVKPGNSIYGFYNTFNNCYSMDELTNLPFIYSTYNSSYTFYKTFSYCFRLKELTFRGGEITATNYKGATLDLTDYVGYQPTSANYLKNNCGFTEDTRVIDDETYQSLKDNPDYWTSLMAYSRYNHNSAVNTLNSLPDCSSLSVSNTIKFKGEAGSATDGGAINTLTEEEIAVATAKGWTVSLV